MLVEEVATTGVVSVPADESLHSAVTAMHEEETPYCVVAVDGIPSGVVTEHRALVACRQSGRALEEIPLTPFATGFEVVVTPHRTIYYAVGLMVSHDVDVLPVKEGMEIVGMLTREHVMENLTNLTRETVDNLGQGNRWNR